MPARSDLPIVEAQDRATWEQWRAVDRERTTGGVAEAREEDVGDASVSYAEAVEAVVRYGSIDSQKSLSDEEPCLQRFTPRGPRSKWSEVNREKATTLIAEGRMTAAGIAQVQAAKQDGRWDAAYRPRRGSRGAWSILGQ